MCFNSAPYLSSLYLKINQYKKDSFLVICTKDITEFLIIISTVLCRKRLVQKVSEFSQLVKNILSFFA